MQHEEKARAKNINKILENLIQSINADIINKETWYVVDGKDTALSGTGKESLPSALGRTMAKD